MTPNDEWLALATPDDATFFNAVANHRDIRDAVAGPLAGNLDLTPLLCDPKIHCLLGKYGFSIFRRYAQFLWEWHCATLPEATGRWRLGAGRASLDYLFSHTDAVAAVAAIPQPNKGARVLVGALNFKLCNVLPAAWPLPGGNAVPLHVYAMMREDWGLRCQ
jgi:hypothetical protein